MAVATEDLQDEFRIDFLVAMTELVKNGVKCDVRQYKEYFAQNAADRPYFDDVMRILNV